MSQSRGYANHSLYMAKILLDQWDSALGEGGLPANVLEGAFAPAVRLHLLDGYGWFLLATIRSSRLPVTPPHRVAELPDLDRGIAIPGEVKEYAHLEQEGWLRNLIQPVEPGLPRKKSAVSIAMTVDTPNIDQYREWHATFQALFARMSDSLDEY